MNALTIKTQAGITPALAGEASNETRDLTSLEVDQVAGGGPTLVAITGILLLGIVLLDFGEDIKKASDKFAEWIRD